MERRFTTSRLNVRVASVMAGLLLATTAVSHAQIPPGYELIQITDDPDYDGPPSINNCGQVVFSKRIGNDFNHEEIFLWDNGVLTQITDDEHRDAFPKINDHGTIVWSRTTEGVDTHFEIARWSGGEIEILTDTPSLSEVAGEINNHDRMAWSRYIGGDCAKNDLYFFDGVDEHQITTDIFSNQGGAINDSDQIAWTQYNFCVAPWVGTIFLSDEGEISQLTNDGYQLAGADIASNGTVVWGGPPNGIEQWKDGVRTVLVPYGEKPEINAFHWVTFNCFFGTNLQACLYTNGQVYQLTDSSHYSVPSSINDFGEVGIRSQPKPTTFDSDIFLMRTTFVSPDLDRNGVVDSVDFASWVAHFAGPSETRVPCVGRRFDLNQNGDVDLIDFGRIQIGYDGS